MISQVLYRGEALQNFRLRALRRLGWVACYKNTPEFRIRLCLCALLTDRSAVHTRLSILTAFSFYSDITLWVRAATPVKSFWTGSMPMGMAGKVSIAPSRKYVLLGTMTLTEAHCNDLFACALLGGGNGGRLGDSLCQVGQCLFHLVHQDQAEVARLKSLKCRIDSEKFTANFIDAFGATSL